MLLQGYHLKEPLDPNMFFYEPIKEKTIDSVDTLTDVVTSCRKRKGGLFNNFSVSGGFLTIFPRVSCVFLSTLSFIFNNFESNQ